MTPILVEAIREMNLKIVTINDMETGNVWRDAIVAWLGNVENGIAELFAKRIITDELCLSDENGTTCYTRSQLDSFINTGNSEVFIQNGSLENETPINNPNSGDINQTNINLETGDGTNEQNTENQTPESQSNVETTITQVDIETNIDPALIDTVNK